MPYIIVKPTRREREERLAESRAQSGGRLEGVVRTTEEAHDIERQRAREGHEFKRPYGVADSAPEAKEAERDLLLKHGIDPETQTLLHSRSTEHRP